MLTGTLPYDPELRFTRSGLALLTFDLACDGSIIRCVAWRDLAEKIANNDKFFRNRTGLYSVNGYWKKREWIDYKTGEKQFINEYVIRHMWDSDGIPA